MKNKKKNNHILLIIIIVLALAFIGGGIYYLLNKEDKTSNLSYLEKKWIESNKDKVVDVSVLNDVPVFGYEGKGVFFTFLNDFEKATGLEFNLLSYNKNGNSSGEYAYKILGVNDTPSDKQIVIYKDEYVFLSKENKLIEDINELNNVKIGILNNDLENVNYYLGGLNNSFTPSENIDAVLSNLDSGVTNYVVIPYVEYMDKILKKADINIVYHSNNMSRNYVLELSSSNNKLNDIINKYYQIWKEDNINTINQSLLSFYYSNIGIGEKEKANFKSRRYIYGYVDSLPYDSNNGDDIVGINGYFIEQFALFSDIEFTYKKFANVQDLKTAISQGEIDVTSGEYLKDGLNVDIIETNGLYYEPYVILSHYTNTKIFDSVKGLKNQSISVISNTKLKDYLVNNGGVIVKEYATIEELLNKIDENSLIAIDKSSYEYYRNAKLNQYVVSLEATRDEANKYYIRSISTNETLAKILKFYSSVINGQQIRQSGYNSIAYQKKKSSFTFSDYIYLLFVLLAIVIILVVRAFIKKGKEKKQLNKEQKIKYIDPMTSLKNRNYLNANITFWDENDIYPQTIIVIDLNNVKYVNDNYGHEEGDKLITKAAGILISNQVPNTDIIRTDGNEFLIYLVGYDEKQIAAYTRKLFKDLKELPHGFGASLGYSMIIDDIKTIDDAINEATIEMRKNKSNN